MPLGSGIAPDFTFAQKPRSGFDIPKERHRLAMATSETPNSLARIIVGLLHTR